MSVVSRHLKVLKLQSSSGLILDHKNSDNVIVLENGCIFPAKKTQEKELKESSSKILDGYGCLGVLSKFIGKRIVHFLLVVTGCRSVGKIFESDILRVNDVAFVALNGENHDSSTFSEIKRLLCSGSFYFALCNSEEGRKAYDITCSANKVKTDRFLWNRSLLNYFSVRHEDASPWCVELMCGGIDIRTIYVGAQQAQACVISRLSCDRVGTRYNVRGVDDDGNVANFVESEQLIIIGEKWSSFLQIRGSVPLHWEQPGLNVGSHKVKLPMTFEISFKAYEKHLSEINELYGSCAIVNLLGSKEGEASLTQAFQNHHEKSSFAEATTFINFDYHSECRVGGKFANVAKLLDKLSPLLTSWGVYYESGDVSGTQQQKGVLRVNCLDCLDRTNSVETAVGLQMIERQLEALSCSSPQLTSRFNEALKAVWQSTGDLISRMYAGTGALEGKDKVGKIKDGARSLSRAIQNNLLDQGKQEAMDKLLQVAMQPSDLTHVARTLLDPHQFLSSSEQAMCELYRRRSTFSEEYSIRVCVGTWNVNGGKLFRSIAYKDKTLKDWLFMGDCESSKTRYFQATFDYDSNEDGDLNFTVGDLISVDAELDGGEWLHGSVADKEGIFPATYAAELTNPHLVMHEYNSEVEGDLTLWENEVVDVLEDNGEWLKGSVNRTEGKVEGIFPANFVTKMNAGSSYQADIYAIGFEEMVELNAGNILNASVANQQAWALELQKTIDEDQEFVLLLSGQLVGVCLFLFVRKDLVQHVRDISMSSIKTGMGGTAGNKGAVGISLMLYNTSMCFVCSHFAAGQTQVQERNNDYDEISNKLGFSKGRRLFSHDYVFWCGDFNYRIDLTGSEVKLLIKEQKWEKMKEQDQLLAQKNMGNVFKGFMEGDINFAPTYKYDLFSDDYDTSEKCRVPAWTDRVLWIRQAWDQIILGQEPDPSFDCGDLKQYSRTELKTSDHRPVVAHIDIKVEAAIAEKRSSLYDDIRRTMEPINASIYMYLEDAPFNSLRCERFLEENALQDFVLCRSFRCCLLLAYATWCRAEEVLEFDRCSFDGSKVRLRTFKEWSDIDESNLVGESPNKQVDEEINSLTSSALKCPFPKSSSTDNFLLPARTALPRPNSTPFQLNQGSTLPRENSSDILRPVHSTPSLLRNEPAVPRPSSTPCVTRDPPTPSKPPKKAPPRPPAISYRPAPTEKPVVTSFPEAAASFSHALSRLGDSAANGDYGLVPPFRERSTGSDLSAQMASMDFSIFEGPPQIKPRKTVPKRAAPIPPRPAPVPPKTTPVPPKPAPPRPAPKSRPKSNLNPAFDDPFGETPSIDPFSSIPVMASSMPAPLIPLAAPQNGKPPKLNPWGKAAVASLPKIAQSFSTNFSDFNAT